jgi:riboflavin synthase
MFTGLISDVGTIRDALGGRLHIVSRYDPADIAIGASIACDGCCLTVVACEADGAGGSVFQVDASAETLSRSTLGSWRAGRRINLERALRLGDELGGHLVSGHIDGIAVITARQPDGLSVRFEFETPLALAPLIAEKGSVALDGTSLTVNTVADQRFSVNLIPHSLAVTTWQEKHVGDQVNLEVDMFARYIARLLEAGRRTPPPAPDAARHPNPQGIATT